MNPDELFKRIKNGGLHGALIFYGQERLALENAADQLTTGVELPEFNTAYLEAPSVQRIIEDCETLPIVAERRVVFIKQSGFLKIKKKNDDDEKTQKEEDTGEHGDAKQLLEYIQKLPETTCLVFIEGESLNTRSRLFKTIAESGGVVEFAPYSDAQLARWAADRAAKNGCMMSAECAEKLVFMVGREMTDIGAEVDKVCSLAGNEPVTIEMVNSIVTKNLEYTVFEMMGHFLNGRLTEGFSQLDDSIKNQEPVIKMVGFFAYQFRNLYRARLGLDAGVPESRLAQQLTEKGRSTYGASQRIKEARGFSAKQLERAIRALTDVDIALKSTGTDGRTALEKALTEVFTNKNTKIR